MSDKKVYERFKENAELRECPVCKKEFMPTSGSQIYCSFECKMEMQRIRKPKVGNAVRVTPPSKMSDNMKKIAEMVKDDPRYGMKVAKEDGYVK
ncbi:MAG: hypothetical protein IKD87_07195 [Oscillospiraceae bacterium]|nr:hypothetical protein [Oscillospiraceae bacterium]